jgi:hypothetical protein
MAFAFLLDEKGSAMRTEDNPDDYKATLELSDAAPNSVTSLLFRLVVRDAQIDAHRAKATLEAAGKNVSPTSANMIVSDAKRMLRILRDANLLCDDFDVKRRRRFHDFIERAPKKKRRRE